MVHGACRRRGALYENPKSAARGDDRASLGDRVGRNGRDGVLALSRLRNRRIRMTGQ